VLGANVIHGSLYQGGGFGAMLEVVPVLRNEREQLFKMVEDYWRTRLTHKPSADDPRVRDRRFGEEFWNERESRFLWWAKLNETAIGFAKTELVEDLVWETQGEIGDFYIAPPFRRGGHGKAFARLLFNWFAQKGVKYVRLYVRSDNPGALAFWENEEFETVQIWHQMRRMVR